MPEDITVEWYWDGKVRVFQLSDGSVVRQKAGSGDQPSEVVGRYLRDRGLQDFRLSFREVVAPRRNRR